MKNEYEIIFKEKNCDEFWQLFEKLKSYYEFIGHDYSNNRLDYYFVRARESGYSIKDYSCIFTFDNKPYSAFLGAAFTKKNESKLDLFEIPCLAIDAFYITITKPQDNSHIDKVNTDKLSPYSSGHVSHEIAQIKTAPTVASNDRTAYPRNTSTKEIKPHK